MIHFLPDPETAIPATSSALALRAGGLARALEVAERLGGEPPSAPIDVAGRLTLAANADFANDLSERAAAAAAAGLEAIAQLSEAGGTANPAAARLLADTIRDALDEMGALLSL